MAVTGTRPSQRARWPSILGSVGVALIVDLIALPAPISAFRPDLVALLVIFWTVYAPGRFGMGAAWVTGLLVDAAQFALLGPHAFSKCLLAYVAGTLRSRVDLYATSQQAIVVFLLLVLDALLVMGLRRYFDHAEFSTGPVIGAAVGMCLWPFLVRWFRPARRPATVAR